MSVTGAGVEASFQKAGTKRWLRFGSQAYVSQGLPKTEVDSIAEACQHRGADQVVSLLVESRLQPAETRFVPFAATDCILLHQTLTGKRWACGEARYCITLFRFVPHGHMLSKVHLSCLKYRSGDKGFFDCVMDICQSLKFC